MTTYAGNWVEVYLPNGTVRRDWVPVIYNLRSLAVRKVTTAVTVAPVASVRS